MPGNRIALLLPRYYEGTVGLYRAWVRHQIRERGKLKKWHRESGFGQSPRASRDYPHAAQASAAVRRKCPARMSFIARRRPVVIGSYD